MATAATYRISSGDFFTPGDLAADAQTLDAQVKLTDLGTPEWAAFAAQWDAFYADHFGGFLSTFFTAFNDGNRDQLVQFEARYSALAAAAGVSRATDVQVKPDVSALDQLKGQLLGSGPLVSWSTALVVVAVIVAIVALRMWATK